MNKKGILLTISMLVLMMVIMSLAMLSFKHGRDYEERFAELGVLTRMQNLDDSIQKGFQEVFDVYPKINITITDTGIIIEDHLPFTEHDQLSGLLENFSNFVESKFDEVDIALGDYNAFDFIIQPGNVTYNHSEWNPHDAIFTDVNGAYAADIYIYTYDREIQGMSWGSASSGSFRLNVSAEDVYGNFVSEEKFILIYGNDEININLQGDKKIKIKSDSGEGLFKIRNEDDEEVLVRITYDLNTTGDITIGYPVGSLNINYPGMGVSKAGQLLLSHN